MSSLCLNLSLSNQGNSPAKSPPPRSLSDKSPGLPFQGVSPAESPGVGPRVVKADVLPGAPLKEATEPKGIQAASRVKLCCCLPCCCVACP